MIPETAVTPSGVTPLLCAVLRCQMPILLYRAHETLPFEFGILELGFAGTFLWAIKLASDAWRSREISLCPEATIQQPKSGVFPKADACTRCRATTAKSTLLPLTGRGWPLAVSTPACAFGTLAQGKFDRAISFSFSSVLTRFTGSARQCCRVIHRLLASCRCGEIP